MNVLSIDVEMIGDEKPKPGRVQIRSRSDNPIGRETRELPGDISQYVDRIGNYQQNRVPGVLRELGDDISEKGHVPLEQVQPRLTCDLPRTSSDDAEIGSGGDGVIDRGDDLSSGEKGSGVLEVEHFATEFIGLGVDEDELVDEVLGKDGLGNGHADIAGADDGDLGVALGWGRWGGFLDGLEEGL